MRMKAAGISTIRVAEFAWAIFEPREGEFSFAFFDGFLALCKEIGMKVIFGTPTATPPAWLTEKYPDTLYQYRPEWLGRQSLDLYIPSLQTAIEYQGIQHYLPVEFFGGEDALDKRQELDRQKKALCNENAVRLIEWPYDIEPTDANVKALLS